MKDNDDIYNNICNILSDIIEGAYNNKEKKIKIDIINYKKNKIK